jgi:hypothetical protein
MAQKSTRGEQTAPPWPQRLLDNIWLLAGWALVFWALSYIVWGLIDLMAIPGG